MQGGVGARRGVNSAGLIRFVAPQEGPRGRDRVAAARFGSAKLPPVADFADDPGSVRGMKAPGRCARAGVQPRGRAMKRTARLVIAQRIAEFRATGTLSRAPPPSRRASRRVLSEQLLPPGNSVHTFLPSRAMGKGHSTGQEG